MTANDWMYDIIGCAYKVHNVLGSGFLEKVYENAMRIELQKLGINAKPKEVLPVLYEGHIVGEYYPDIWVEGRLIIEVKANQTLVKQNEVQLVHYLTATGIDDGLLINFGPSVQIRRKFREYKPKGSASNNQIFGA
jgi:GxxExxY protein